MHAWMHAPTCSIRARGGSSILKGRCQAEMKYLLCPTEYSDDSDALDYNSTTPCPPPWIQGPLVKVVRWIMRRYAWDPAVLPSYSLLFSPPLVKCTRLPTWGLKLHGIMDSKIYTSMTWKGGTKANPSPSPAPPPGLVWIYLLGERSEHTYPLLAGRRKNFIMI